ncbi:MAG: hypothetical protein RR646_00355 [Erysipelotrichaceae bacterium]
MQELNKNILEAEFNIHHRDKLQLEAKNLEIEITELKLRIKNIRNSIEASELDVLMLEKISVKNILSSFNGRKKDSLKREEANSCRNILDYKQLQTDLEYLEFDYNRVLSELDTLSDTEVIYNNLIATKRKEINGTANEEIFKLENLLVSLNAKNENIEATINAGNKVVQGLNKALDSLKLTEESSKVDYIQKGIFANFAKNGNIEDAQRELSSIKGDLNNFKKQILTVDSLFMKDIEIEQLPKLSDYIFDDVYTDRMVNAKIASACGYLLEINANVKRMLHYLKMIYEKNQYQYDSCKDEINKIIITYNL